MSSSFFPAQGGNPTWVQDVTIYAGPGGSDSNNGNNPSKPFLTAYAAAAALVAQGGGTLYLADNCEIGNPVAGLGLCFRGDGFTVPGFLPTAPMVITGMGRSEGAGPFQPPVASQVIGAGGRLTPVIQVVASNDPVRIEYLTPKFPHARGAMIGCDWTRNIDGTLLDVTITNATRTSTSTVYTVTLPTAITVLSASRTSNITTLTITNPGMPYIPFRLGSKIRFTSTDEVKFPSGDYTLTGSGNPIADNATWTITYADAGTNQTLASPGTVKSHGCNPGDYIDLTSTDVHFPSNRFKVTATSITTITVLDNLGDGNANVNNIGTLVRQERFLSYATAYLYRCGFGIDETDSTAGPSVDIGHTQGTLMTIDESWVTGYVGNGTGPRDEDRMAAVLVDAGDAGSIGPPAASLRMLSCNGSNGTVQVNSSLAGVVYVNIDYLLMEAGFPELELPVLRVNGNQYTRVAARDVYNADNSSTAVTCEINGVPFAGTDMKRCGIISGSVNGGDYWLEPSQWNTGLGVPNPWQKRQVTVWADGRVTGQHPGAARSLGVYQPRYANKALVPGSWTGGHVTVTTGQPGFMSSTSGTRLQNSVADFIAMKALASDGNTWTAGGKLVISGWINSTTDADFVPTAIIQIVSGGAITFEEGDLYPVPFRGRGWQFIQCLFTVATTSSTTPSYYPALYLGSGSDAYVDGWSSYYIPASVNDNDAFEQAFAGRNQPVYLPVGVAGTMENVPLIGHGGLGVSAALAKTAGVGSGQLTLTGTGTTYIPIYAADGTTIQGWVAQLQATVNP